MLRARANPYRAPPSKDLHLEECGIPLRVSVVQQLPRPRGLQVTTGSVLSSGQALSGLLRDPGQPSSTALQQFAPAIPDQGSPTGLRDTDRKEIGGQALFLSRPRHGLEVLQR